MPKWWIYQLENLCLLYFPLILLMFFCLTLFLASQMFVQCLISSIRLFRSNKIHPETTRRYSRICLCSFFCAVSPIDPIHFLDGLFIPPPTSIHWVVNCLLLFCFVVLQKIFSGVGKFFTGKQINVQNSVLYKQNDHRSVAQIHCRSSSSTFKVPNSS